jgi:hypothetical protein
MAIMLMEKGIKENIERKQHPSVSLKWPITLDYANCMETYVNGVPILGIMIIKAHQ